MAANPDDKSTDIPDRLFDSNQRKTYKSLRFFGQGGFAKCYEIIDVATDETFAGKTVSKKLMIKHKQNEKIPQETTIHRSLNHPNVVMFHSYFEDVQNIFIVLELCKKRSMMELNKRRKSITEFECSYDIYQIIQGVKYLHDNRIIHRDQKFVVAKRKVSSESVHFLVYTRVGVRALLAMLGNKARRTWRRSSPPPI